MRKIRKRYRILLLVVFLCGSVSFNPYINYGGNNEFCSPRSSEDTPISITGESELISAVDRGSGTAGDPYVIENRIFNASDLSGPAIRISVTHSYLILQNITIYGPILRYQIEIANAKNIWIKNCTFRDIGVAVYMSGTIVDNVNISDCLMEDNSIYTPSYAFIKGNGLEPEMGIWIYDNTIRNSSIDGIQMYASSNVTIFDNTFDTIYNSRYGILFWNDFMVGIETDNITIYNNTIKNIGGTGAGINVNTLSGHIYNNAIENCAYGISSEDGSYVRIENNTIDGDLDGYGIAIASNHSEIIHNTLKYCDTAISIWSFNTTVSDNYIDYVAFGVSNGISTSSDTLNFTLDGNYINNTRLGFNLQGGTNGIIKDNIVKNSIVRSIWVPNDLTNITIFGNEFYNASAHIDASLSATYTNFHLDNGSVGNYWDDYKSRYPAATHNGYYYSIPYEATGVGGLFDNYPTIGDEVPTADFDVNETEIVAGMSVEAEFTGEIGNLIVDYQWNFGEVAGNETVAVPEYTYTSPGIYDISLTVTDSDGDIATITKGNHITVLPDEQPLANFDQNATTIFEGEEIQFTFTGNTGNTPVEYQWDFGDESPTSDEQNPVHAYLGGGTYTVSLIVTDFNGDTSHHTKIDLITVEIDYFPVAEFSGIPTTVIDGKSVQFYWGGVYGNGDNSFEWCFGDSSPNSTETYPTHVFPGVGTYSITLTITDEDGDISTLTKEDYITVITDLLPSANFVANNTSLEINETIQFTFTGNIGNGGESFQWDFGDGTANSTLTNPTHVYTTPGDYTVTLTVEDTDGDIAVFSIEIHISEPKVGLGIWEIIGIILGGLAVVGGTTAAIIVVRNKKKSPTRAENTDSTHTKYSM
ncbi:MAG: PKD domain-containing protein [Promethearchaeota archaeon]|nr:MAG: PKD domain-containing protein [Candidatus Lokiarchaeota archaeon]